MQISQLKFVFTGSRRGLVDFDRMVKAERVFLREDYREQEVSPVIRRRFNAG
jgi:hypothetical protein